MCARSWLDNCYCEFLGFIASSMNLCLHTHASDFYALHYQICANISYNLLYNFHQHLLTASIFSSDSVLKHASSDFRKLGQRIFVFVIGGATRSEVSPVHCLVAFVCYSFCRGYELKYVML